jgi:hypothetical protein
MATWAFFNNAALTGSAMTEIPATVYPVSTVQVWFGSTTSGYKLQAASNPGTDHLYLSVVDSATGTGHATTAVKLATTSGGLATATAGVALDLNTVIYGGASLAEEIWIEVTDAVGQVAKSTELSLQLTPWVQSAT